MRSAIAGGSVSSTGPPSPSPARKSWPPGSHRKVVDEDGAYGAARARACAPAPPAWRDGADPRLAQLPPGIDVDRTLGDAVGRSGCAGDLRRGEGLRLGVGGVLDEPGVDRLRAIGVPGGLLEPRGAQQRVVAVRARQRAEAVHDRQVLTSPGERLPGERLELVGLAEILAADLEPPGVLGHRARGHPTSCT